MEKLIIGCVLVALTTGMVFGLLSFLAWLVMVLWNFIAVETHHPSYQISFLVALAAVFLLGLVNRCFRVVVVQK